MISGIYSVLLGFDNTVEFKLYHYWNGYSFATGRVLSDMAFCGIQSYFNPLFDVQFYYLSKLLNQIPQLFLFIQGIWGAMALFALYKISDLILKGESLNKTVAMIFIVISSASSYLFFYEQGTSLVDMQICFLPLFGIYFLLKRFPNSTTREYLLAGLLFGLSAGLKLTMFAYVLALFVLLILYSKKIANPTKNISCYVLGCLIGFMITGGYWYFLMLKIYGNPFFPLYNNIFHSDFTTIQTYSFKEFFPKNIAQWLVYPLFWEDNDCSRVIPLPFRDYRWISAYIVSSLIFIITVFKPNVQKSENTIVDLQRFNFVNFFIIISYIVWLKVFAVIRHAILIDFFLGLIIAIGVYLLLDRLNLKKILPIVLLFLLSFYIRSTNYVYLRIKPENRLIEVSDIKIPDKSMVFSAGLPIGFAGVFQNPNCVYYYGYTDVRFPFEYSQKNLTATKKLMESKIDKLYAIWGPDGQYEGPQIFEPDYRLDKDSCKIIPNSNGEMIGFCKIIKLF